LPVIQGFGAALTKLDNKKPYYFRERNYLFSDKASAGVFISDPNFSTFFPNILDPMIIDGVKRFFPDKKCFASIYLAEYGLGYPLFDVGIVDLTRLTIVLRENSSINIKNLEITETQLTDLHP